LALIRKYLTWASVALSFFGYYLFAFHFQRSDHTQVLFVFVMLTVLAFLIFYLKTLKNWLVLFGIGLALRCIFFGAEPALSDDYFRFKWDGELTQDGYSVFAFVPSQYAKHVSSAHQNKYEQLLQEGSDRFPEGMNSKNYYSIYPSVNQFAFYTMAKWGGSNTKGLIVLRIWVLLAEVVSFFLLRSLLEEQKKSHWLTLYWLHPLVIIELTGNLHFEALAITFLLFALVFAQKQHAIGTALAVALGVMTKLTPLLLLGALYKQFHWKKWLSVCIAAVLISCVLFLCFIDLDTFGNFKKSVGLFFAWFSFNAGVYYAIRDFVLFLVGSDVSAWISLFFPFISGLIMFRLVFIGKQDMLNTALLIFTTYFLFTPILHPWYITVLIPLGILSQRVFPLVWSVLIFGTYMAYGKTFSEPLWWIYFEFGVVLLFLFSEYRNTPNWSHRLAQKIYA
jgi:hypothetical protein